MARLRPLLAILALSAFAASSFLTSSGAADAAGPVVGAGAAASTTSTASTASANAVAPSSTDVDDAVIGDAAGQFSYSDGWSHCTECGPAGETVPLFGASNSWSSTKGASATFRFTGTAVTLYGVTHPKAGIATVSVDGGKAETIDFHASERKGNQPVYTVDALANGAHEVTVTVTGTHSASSSGNVVNLDRAAFIDPDAPVPSVYTDVIPKPVSADTASGTGFTLTRHSRIVADSSVAPQAEYLAESLRPATGYKLKVVHSKARTGDIVLSKGEGSPAGHEADGYSIAIGAVATISANENAGIANGIATLRQLLPDWIEAEQRVDVEWTIPAGAVSDYPRFAYRGVMVDLSRAYMSPDQLEGIIDQSARLKLNQLHLHLTDDPAWRIAISTPKENPSGIDYDRLIEIGSHGGVITGFSEDDPHPGHYTQKQYQDIVSYAAARGMTVIPEIDGPAHSTAATASIPQLNASGSAAPIFIPTDGKRTYFDPALPATKEFFRTVFGQLAEMTPGPYLNFGGDEAAGMSESDYAAYLAMVKDIIRDSGKTPIGWNETAAHAGEGDVVQHWVGGLAETVAAAGRGAKVIMSPAPNTYFDQIYAPGVPADAVNWACPTGCGVDRAYNWNPVQAGLQESDVIGVEGATWGYAADTIGFLYNPRILATAEVGWTAQQSRSFEDFTRRLASFGVRFDASDTNFYADPAIGWQAAVAPVSTCLRGKSIDGPVAIASAPQISPKQALIMVDYGDGTPAVPALVTAAHSEANNRAHGLFIAHGSHTFAKSGTYQGSLTFTVGATGKTVKAPSRSRHPAAAADDRRRCGTAHDRRRRVTIRPNIILIVIDDLGWRDLGCYGSSFYETPHIDELARDGMLFSDAYASAPVCSPSRASVLSGKYPARVGVTQWIGGHGVGSLNDVPYLRELPENEYSLARALRAGGYATWHVGKWHLGPRRCWPEHHGFDVNIGGCDLGSPRTYESPYGIPTLPDGPDGEYLTDRLTDEAIRLIEQNEKKPFFLNLWHYAVHTPIMAPAPLVEKYVGKAHRSGVDVDAVVEGELMPAWHLRGRRVQRRTVQSDPGYAAMIENLDANVGRLRDALRACDKHDETLIVFTSDNGGLSTAEGSPTCNAPLAQGKGWMHDGGVRVPFIVSWPGHVPRGTRTDRLVTSPDLYPTLLTAAGLPPIPSQHVDGVDLLPQWTGGEQERGPIFWHYPHYSNQGGTPGAAVRDGSYKLIRFFEDGHEELYDLASDIGETRDLAARLPLVRARLSALLSAWSGDVHALIPSANPYSADDSLWRDEGENRTAQGPE